MSARRRSMWHLVAAVGGSVLLALLAPSALARPGAVTTAPAVHPGSHSHSALAVVAREVGADTWAIEAQVRDMMSGPVGGVTVEFSAKIEFLGVRTLDLGSARADTSGAATLTYSPTTNGVHHIVARVPFDDGVLISNEAVFEVTGATPQLAPPTQRLPAVGAWAGPVAALVVASVWGLLVLVFVRVVVGISQATVVQSTANRRFGGSTDIDA